MVYVSAKIAEVEKMRKGGRDESLGSVYLLLGDDAKHCFELSDQIQRSERPGAKLVFGVDLLEGDTAEAGTNGRVKISCNPVVVQSFSTRWSKRRWSQRRHWLHRPWA
jgi:hypothetical protein